MSTLLSSPVPQPSWKEEVNRRLEAHKNRKGLSVVDPNEASDDHSTVSDRAAKARARVAARYAKAPSYSDMQAAEARAALRAAEVATRAALEAQAVAQAALDNWEASAEEKHDCDHEASVAVTEEQSTAPTPATPATPTAQQGVPHRASLQVRWEPDLPQRPAQRVSIQEHHNDPPSLNGASVSKQPGIAEDQAIEIVDAQPIHANVIHFPRELVATRRVRPRLVGSPEASEAEINGQLSIFEVEAGSISIDPTASTADAASPAPSWSGPEWSGIKLDAQPLAISEKEFQGGPPASRTQVHLAPLELRLMAAAIDFALTLALVCAAIAGVAGHLEHGFSLKTAEVDGIAAFVLAGILYQAFFLLTTLTTPGMMYAGIALCTFEDEHPTRAQLRDRLGAFLVSLFPVGLGMAWAIFDEDHLSWHDRLSRTYQRKC